MDEKKKKKKGKRNEKNTSVGTYWGKLLLNL